MSIFNQGSLITASGVQKLEQNFAGSSAPSSPVTGQLWYDTGAATLKVYNGVSWSQASGGQGVGFNPAGNWMASYSTGVQYTNSTAYMALIVGSLSPTGNFNSAYVYINGAQVSWDNSGSSGYATQVVGLCPPGSTFQCGGVAYLRVFI